MRLTWRDALATLFVAAAVALYGLWLTGTAAAGTSTRVLGAVVFGLGWAGCVSDQREMASVYGAGGYRRAPMAYVVVASLLGAVALAAGIMTLVSASEVMLAVLMAATIALWLLATVRHATSSEGRPGGQPVREPTRTTAPSG
jgi:hypothetical protein